MIKLRKPKPDFGQLISHHNRVASYHWKLWSISIDIVPTVHFRVTDILRSRDHSRGHREETETYGKEGLAS